MYYWVFAIPHSAGGDPSDASVVKLKWQLHQISHKRLVKSPNWEIIIVNRMEANARGGGGYLFSQSYVHSIYSSPLESCRPWLSTRCWSDRPYIAQHGTPCVIFQFRLARLTCSTPQLGSSGQLANSVIHRGRDGSLFFPFQSRWPTSQRAIIIAYAGRDRPQDVCGCCCTE